MDRLNCINPDEIEEGDLVAYIYGDASPTVVKHIAHCPYCSAQVEELRKVDTSIAALFYRDQCPTAETLAAFVLGHLPPVEKLKVAAHVRTCPACSAEVAAVGNLEEDEPPSLLAWLRRKLAQATMARQMTFAPTPLRGNGRWKGRFESDDLVVTLAISGDRLTGRVRWRDSLSPVREPGKVWLVARAEEGRISQSVLDEQGRFRFEALPPGFYTLLLEVAGRDVTLEKEVRIG